MVHNIISLIAIVFAFTLTGCFEKTSFTFPETELAKTSAAIDVVIYNPAPQDISISDIKFSNPEFFTSDKTPFVLKPEQRRVLKMYYKPAKVGASSGNILVTAKKAGYDIPVQIAFVQGKGKKATTSVPKLVLSPLNYDFGSVKIGETVTTPITLSNQGTSPLIVSGMDSPLIRQKLLPHSQV